MTPLRSRFTRLLLAALLGLAPVSTPGQMFDMEQVFEDRNLEPVRQLLLTGEYDLCVRVGQLARDRGLKSIEWRLIHLDALQALGRLQEVLDESASMLIAYPDDLRLLIRRLDAARGLGLKTEAEAILQAINQAARAKPASERDAEEWAALGRAAIVAGADAQKVITNYFQVAQKKDAKAEAPWLAEGRLALEKSDAGRAATVFRAGLKNHGETAALRHGLASALMNSDRAAVAENLTRALEINPHHEGALLLRAELAIGAEKFLEAEADIQRVLDLNDSSPLAWALRAAIASITTADAARVEAARRSGLKRWDRNPEVDHHLGRVVSRAYRFAEGAAHQRQALAFDPSCLPAKLQLCNDLLRLGEEAEAFELAAAIRAVDGYNVLAHNLGTLEKQIAKYAEERTPHFTIKMPGREQPIYGPRAVALLEEAYAELGQRYQLPLPRTTLVEFFPSQQDFAIRTFGNLGGQGILGACFGSVVTMNSPGSLGHGRNNWESTLWHEFCHVITLTATRNRMPRWLSEGISVHEEGRRDPAWGMKMNADYREKVLAGLATPVSQLSQAFLTAKDGDDLMFAYFQAGEVVSWLVEKHGHEALLGIMRALAEGTRVNDAISQHALPIEAFEEAFARHLQTLAEGFGQEADWSEPELEDLNPADPESLAEFIDKNPRNLSALRRLLDLQMQASDWDKALVTADKLTALLPDDASEGSAWWAKARLHREKKQIVEETEVLRHLAARNSSALNTFLRLIELESETQSWPQVIEHAQRALALNPFLRTPNEALARAASALGDSSLAIIATRRLLSLDPPNPASLHHQLALLLRASEPEAARRHLLDALALAPRFRAAHELLLEWQQ